MCVHSQLPIVPIVCWQFNEPIGLSVRVRASPSRLLLLFKGLAAPSPLKQKEKRDWVRLRPSDQNTSSLTIRKKQEAASTESMHPRVCKCHTDAEELFKIKIEFLLVMRRVHSVLFFSTNSTLFSRIRKHRIVIQLIELWTVALRIQKYWQEKLTFLNEFRYRLKQGTHKSVDGRRKIRCQGFVVCSPQLTVASSLDGETGCGIFRPSPDTNQFTTLWSRNPSVRSVPHTVQTHLPRATPKMLLC